jgi:adenylate cyclase
MSAASGTVACASCGHANRGAAKFCEECGARLPRACPSCGTAVRPGAKFCDECGHALDGAAPAAARAGAAAAAVAAPAVAAAVTVAPAGPDRAAARPAGYTPRHLAEKILTSRSALEGERKQVSVLFADCVGFTQLSTQLDPEELHRVMDGCFQHLMDGVHRYEGTVNQFTGDGIMALFGAPIAHEDHAVRAVAAALAMQKGLGAYAAFLREDCGLELSVRIGVNTGPVVVGKIGDDLRMDYTAQGETVNLAARLQAAAPPGGVLVSQATHELVSGYFVTQEAGRLELKGLPAPVAAYTVVRQRGGRARFDVAVERGLTPLVGRARELAFLGEAATRAGSGRGQVVSVAGDAGVGKSRLAWEFRRALDQREVTCLLGRCLPHGAALPFHLIVAFLQANFRLDDGEGERAQVAKVEEGVRRLDPAIAWIVPYVKLLLALPAPELEAEGLDQVQRKRRMIEAVRALVLRGAQHRPLVLVAEDLQWIDASSEELLTALVDSLAGHRVLIVTTHRTGYAPPWQDRSYHQRLALDPLSVDETRAMARSLLGPLDGDGTLEELVVRRAEGNPFFVEELTRYIRGHGGAGASGERDVPGTVQDLLTARIDRLPEAAKRTLQLAAVLGRDFSRGLLEAVAPGDLDVTVQLGELLRHELLREKTFFPEPHYTFGHLLIQQVAYQGLLVKARTEIHGRAARALERLHAGRLEEVLADLAGHYALGGDRDKAVEYLVRAGDRALSLFAYADAERDYRRALEAMPAGAGTAAIVERLGDVAFARGAIGEALARWREVAATLDGGASGRRRGDLHRKMATACWAAAEKDAALAHLREGLAALDGDAENLEAARLFEELGRIHFRLGEHEQATEWAKRALALGVQLGAPDVVSHAYNTWGVALARAGDIEGGAEFVRRSLDAALAHGLSGVACRAYTNLAVMYATIDHVRSLEFCREGLALARRIGDQLQEAWLYCTLAGGHCTLAGDYDEGVLAAEAAVEIDERLGQRSHLPIPLIILGQIHQCRGDHAQSAGYYARALEVAEAISEPQLLFPCYEGLATLALEQGDEPRAMQWLAKSREVQEATGWTSDAFMVLPFLC